VFFFISFILGALLSPYLKNKWVLGGGGGVKAAGT